jgi:putative transposase
LRILGELELSSIMHSWKSLTANQLQRKFGRHGAIWLHESWDRIIRDEDELLEKCNYILNNPFKRWPELREYPWMGWE